MSDTKHKHILETDTNIDYPLFVSGQSGAGKSYHATSEIIDAAYKQDDKLKKPKGGLERG